MLRPGARSRMSMTATLLALVLSAGVLASAGCVTRTAQDPPVEAPAAAAAPDTLALPELSTALSPEAISTLLGARATPHRYAQDEAQHTEGWEWSEPAGRYAVATYESGHLVGAMVRRPYVEHLPEVVAQALPALHEGMSEAELTAAVGPGWPIERSLQIAGVTPYMAETRAWAIHDRGHDTGGMLRVVIHDGAVISVAHPWRKA